MRKWLKEKRGDRRQDEVAALVGISRPAYSMIETGDRNPSVGVAQRIGEVLGFKWTIFFTHEGNESTPNDDLHKQEVSK